MAPTSANNESGSKRSCLEILSASGYVWSAVEDEHVENRVARDDGYDRSFNLLKVLTMFAIPPR